MVIFHRFLYVYQRVTQAFPPFVATQLLPFPPSFPQGNPFASPRRRTGAAAERGSRCSARSLQSASGDMAKAYICIYILYTHRIHGAGIYANFGGILMGSMLPYIYMDPMGYIYIYSIYIYTCVCVLVYNIIIYI